MVVSIVPQQPRAETPTPRAIRATSRRSGLPVQLAPSASMAGKYHLVSGQGCDCKGYSYRRTCRHFVAFQGSQ
jgi:hypothetical protein